MSGEETQMRRYDDPVEVRRGEAGAFGEGPEQFLWRGRLWKVRTVLGHWVETAPWWQAVTDSTDNTDNTGGTGGTGGTEEPISADLLAERELWRVEAGRGISSTGIFDLSFSWSDGCWQLVGCED